MDLNQLGMSSIIVIYWVSIQLSLSSRIFFFNLIQFSFSHQKGVERGKLMGPNPCDPKITAEQAWENSSF
jgi:hypothetical protein